MPQTSLSTRLQPLARFAAACRLKTVGRPLAGLVPVALLVPGALVVVGLALTGSGLSGSPARAAADSARSVSREATLTLAADPADSQGVVRGALSIDLQPGWHTYWRDPGASGIPPTLDFSATPGLGSVRLRFPAPHRFGADLTRGNGYTQAAAIAFELTPSAGASIGPVDLHVFLGVCRDICVPVEADLAVPKPEDADPRVAAAFAALPSANGTRGTIEPVTMTGNGAALTVKVTYPATPEQPDLFVFGPEGWFFEEPPTPQVEGRHATFTVPIAERPSGTADTAPPPFLDLVATDGATAVEADGVTVSTNADGSPPASKASPTQRR